MFHPLGDCFHHSRKSLMKLSLLFLVPFVWCNNKESTASHLVSASSLFVPSQTHGVDYNKRRVLRETISFDFGWKHRTGLTEWAAPDDLPPTNTDPGWNPPEAQIDYKNDQDWWHVQLPHDGLIANAPSQKACPDGCSGHSYLPRHVLWYRKQFQIPLEWVSDGSLLDLEFDGSFRNTTVWINGKLAVNHDCGYTPFTIRLNSYLLHQDNDNKDSNIKQTIAVFVDPDNGDFGGIGKGSGWWYEGGGLYRHVRLTRITSSQAYIKKDSLFAKSQNLKFDNDDNENQESHHHYRTAMSANLTMQVSINIQNQTASSSLSLNHLQEQQTEESYHMGVYFEVWDPEANILLAKTPTQFLLTTTERNNTSGRKSIRAVGISNSVVTVSQTITLQFVKLWTSRQPFLYQIFAVVVNCTATSSSNNKDSDAKGLEDEIIVDRDSIHHGFRELEFDANQGFFLNRNHFKVRGFCDHDTFAVVGMAVPDRINLFRAQASRSIGGNGRRASHNPPDPAVLNIYDHLGMVVIDENRLFANKTSYVKNMAAMVKRDRNHPSIITWSFCNEAGCEKNQDGGPAFQEVTNKLDGSRPTLANMMTCNGLLSKTIDVQGFSHQPREKLDECHAAMPNKPIFMSECCSCKNIRAEDVGNAFTASFNAKCLDKQVNASDGIDYVAGTMVWTLFDYYGEPTERGLQVSSSYGQFDLCGFPKSAAFWYRTQWLLGVSDYRSDKPFQTLESYEVQIVESWESPDTWNETRGNTTRTIHAYSNAPFIELFVNNKSQGSLPVYPMVRGGGSYAEWKNVPWESGTLLAVAHAANGTSLASTMRRTNGDAIGLSLSLDCPSKITGTGDALLLDGQDVALVRATVVDAFGETVHMASHNITFSVSGPGFVQGTANGDPTSYHKNDATWHTAYHGLLRAVVRVTSIAGLSARERERHQQIEDPSVFAQGRLLTDDTDDIVIEATSPGFRPVQITIPTSTIPSKDSIVAIAKATVGQPVDFFSPTKRFEGSVNPSFLVSGKSSLSVE